MERISVIITCYKPNSVIDDCLDSFASQEKNRLLDIVLVNDCSPFTKDEYQSVIKKYTNTLNIQYLKTPENLGPGMARQYGYDNSVIKNEFILYHDADETCIVPDGMDPFFEAISSHRECQIFVSGFTCEFERGYSGMPEHTIKYIPPEKSRKLTGRLFRRSFLDTNQIKFSPIMSYHDEDNYFLDCCYNVIKDKGLYQYNIPESNSFYIIWEKDHSGASFPVFFTASVAALHFTIFTMLRIMDAAKYNCIQDNELEFLFEYIPFSMYFVLYDKEWRNYKPSLDYMRKAIPKYITVCDDFVHFINTANLRNISRDSDKLINLYYCIPTYENYEHLKSQTPSPKKHGLYLCPIEYYDNADYCSPKDTINKFIREFNCKVD